MTKKVYEDRVWTIPDGVFTDQKVIELYALVSDVVRNELGDRGANALDHLLTERIVFAYCHIRDKDAKAGTTQAWAHDRVRRETIKDFFAAVENLQRRWLRADISDAEDAVKRKFATALRESLMDIDPSVADQLRQTLSEQLEKVGL